MPSALRRLPGCDHHQHDHLVQERTGVLCSHTQLQTRPDVSVSVTSVWQLLDQKKKKSFSNTFLKSILFPISFHLLSISDLIYVRPLRSTLLC